MAVKNFASDTPKNLDVARYRANSLSEQEGVYLYTGLAGLESNAHLAELYRRLAAIERRHCSNYLRWSQEPRQRHVFPSDHNSHVVS